MLTRLEVDGFKNLVDFSVDFGPFTCIAGENGVGKSNVFDAIHFLSLLADRPLMDAAQAVRDTKGTAGADVRDLLWAGARQGTVTLAAEMILPSRVEDDFGLEAVPTSMYVRYEVRLGYVAPEGRQKVGRLALLSESLSPITKAKPLAGCVSRTVRRISARPWSTTDGTARTTSRRRTLTPGS